MIASKQPDYTTTATENPKSAAFVKSRISQDY